MDFGKFLAESAQPVNEYLEGFFTFDGMEDLKRYLYNPLLEYTVNAGKRHRPLICMLACMAVGGNASDAVMSGSAIENFHTAALIHDDIADEAKLRRGKPCMHLSEGLSIAINAGDMALASVISSVLADDALTDEVKLRVLAEIVEMDTKTIEGQALDIGWARDGRYDLAVEDYIEMATRKTAYYSGGIPLAIGAIIGGGTDEQVEALRHFGMLTGLAFQIQDDLINLVGDEEHAGKDFRSDITEGKRTMISVHALRNAPADDADELRAILDSGTEDAALLSRAVRIMEEAGSIGYARDFAHNLIQEAKRVLGPVLPESDYKDTLFSMADFFVDRVG
ncbi:MAG: polyprenyl synthetase family protein [Coriobacteriales bacterium]|jgi:geranylgeranyl diphosphate synthase type I